MSPLLLLLNPSFVKAMIVAWWNDLFAAHVQATLPALSERSQCVLLLKELGQVLDTPYQPIIASGVYITPVVPDILSFTLLLKEINHFLSHQIALDNIRCNFTLTTVSVDAFFISKQNHYIPSDAIFDFHREMVAVCEFTEQGEEQRFGSGVHEHNYRMLTKLFGSLKNVSGGLLEVLSTRV